MFVRPRRRCALWAGLWVLGGCASAQTLSIQTDPSGASVYLQRRGDVEVSGSVAGIHADIDAATFEEDFVFLGTSPVEYEFEREDTEGAVATPRVGGRVTRKYKEGTLRIEMEGYETVERRVRFSGDPVRLVVSLVRRRHR